MVEKEITEQIIDNFLGNLEGNDLIPAFLLKDLENLLKGKKKITKQELVSLLESEVES